MPSYICLLSQRAENSYVKLGERKRERERERETVRNAEVIMALISAVLLLQSAPNNAIPIRQSVEEFGPMCSSLERSFSWNQDGAAALPTRPLILIPINLIWISHDQIFSRPLVTPLRDVYQRFDLHPLFPRTIK